MRHFYLVITAALIFSARAYCQPIHQVWQAGPELCGDGGGAIPLPPGFSVTFDQEGGANITLRRDAKSVRLQDDFSQIDGVCPISDHSMVVFGNLGGSGTSVGIVDDTNPSRTDRFLALNPVMSPDRRWIAFTKFYPRTTELPPSTEYLLYDLSKMPAENRRAGVGLDEKIDVGSTIYPLGWKNEARDNLGAPENQAHGNLSQLFWSPNSDAILFLDQVLEERNLVLVQVDSNGPAGALVHPMPETVECEAAASGRNAAQPVGIRLVRFGPNEASDRLIFLNFDVGEAHWCSPKTQQYHKGDFRPAKAESRVTEKPKHKTVLGKQ